MPLLESLRVNDPDDDELEIDVHASGGTSLPRITLPRLKSLYVDPVTALEKYLEVLEHLVPAPGFSFCSMRTEPFPLDLADFRAIQQIICSYLHILFRGKCPYYLRIIQTSNLFRLHLSRDFYEFDFELDFVTWEEDVPVLLETVRSISLEYTTTFSLDIHTGALRLSNTSLNRVVSSMVSVEELRVTADSLRLLLSLPTATENILLPQLETLELEGDCDVTFLVEFLTQRRALELPIQLLSFYERDLLLHEHCGELRNCLYALEQFDGMKVTWLPFGESAVREYICGSGNPDLRVDNS
ncbi:hypothetical protein GALMADRAFT_450293 [Galerina marginata CBS 339.88]|uniref:F-box domain-containing protein n=1 Tax=Galerina marginata (strain CBS 339.88) TaxID=685588 RepID=A0A067T040_GALM3|nr:hypothetical protein GALMADRAFT_450293 [Galerina marginata CBS 339.88]